MGEGRVAAAGAVRLEESAGRVEGGELGGQTPGQAGPPDGEGEGNTHVRSGTAYDFPAPNFAPPQKNERHTCVVGYFLAKFCHDCIVLCAVCLLFFYRWG